MWFIGDVHGLFFELSEICKKRDPDQCFQLGDMGIGFGLDDIFPTQSNLVFIRGNHDNPAACRKKQGYLGDFGIIDDIFFLSGAWSIDREYRTEGRDWWPDEELNSHQLKDAFDLYVKTKPQIVATHDCPLDVYPYLGYKQIIRTSTASALNMMLKEHAPQFWIFAHHHKHMECVLGKTKFVALTELGEYEVK